MEPPEPEFAVGQRVEVLLNGRNRTAHSGVVRMAVWHAARRRFFYTLVSSKGCFVSKRYFADDLRLIPTADPQEPAWDEDSLSHGYVVARTPEGWWHMHFGRTNVIYDCRLLAEKSCILARVQHFAVGAAPISAVFHLTLDGEGVDLRRERIEFDARWGDKPVDAALAAEALRFQRRVMPLLYVWGTWQKAASEIVRKRRHRRTAAEGRLHVEHAVAAEPRPLADDRAQAGS